MSLCNAKLDICVWAIWALWAIWAVSISRERGIALLCDSLELRGYVRKNCMLVETAVK
jgi:hypothetical protein